MINYKNNSFIEHEEKRPSLWNYKEGQRLRFARFSRSDRYFEP